MGITAPTPEKTPGSSVGKLPMLSTPKLNSTQCPSPSTRKWGVPKFIPPPSSFLCQDKYGRPRSGLGLIQCLECICETSQRAQTFHHKIQMSDILWDRHRAGHQELGVPKTDGDQPLPQATSPGWNLREAAEHQGCSLRGQVCPVARACREPSRGTQIPYLIARGEG